MKINKKIFIIMLAVIVFTILLSNKLYALTALEYKTKIDYILSVWKDKEFNPDSYSNGHNSYYNCSNCNYGGWECLAFARYAQNQLYGTCDKCGNYQILHFADINRVSDFRVGDVMRYRSSYSDHSIVIIDVDISNNKVKVMDCNYSSNDDHIVRERIVNYSTLKLFLNTSLYSGAGESYVMRDPGNTVVTISGSLTGKFPFIDVQEDVWYSNALEYMCKNGYINGTSDVTFSPNMDLSRAMLVTILWNMEGSPKVNGSNKFPDVKNDAWYTNAIIWASTNGIVNGYQDGDFAPNVSITRQEVAVMLSNYCKFKGKFIESNKSLDLFLDNDIVANWAVPSVQWAVENKIIHGAENGTKINPRDTATRVEAITMIKNYIDTIK